MSNLDLNEIAKIEKAIKEKYGEQTIQNPKSYWSKEKEQEYLKQMKEFYSKLHDDGRDREERKGYLISKNFQKAKSMRECKHCDSYSFSFEDDLYFTKFDCCFKCYVNYVEGRESRWKSGWRPNNTKAFND